MRCFGWMGGLGVRAWGLGCSLPVIPSTARDLLSAPPARSLAALGMTSEPGGHADPDCCPNRARPAPAPRSQSPPPRPPTLYTQRKLPHTRPFRSNMPKPGSHATTHTTAKCTDHNHGTEVQKRDKTRG